MLKSHLVLFFDFQKSNSSTVCILLRGIFCDNCLELDSHHFPVYYYYLVGMSNQVVHYESIEEILSVWPDMDGTCCRQLAKSRLQNTIKQLSIQLSYWAIRLTIRHVYIILFPPIPVQCSKHTFWLCVGKVVITHHMYECLIRY